jgi:hypothetical protein
MEYNLSNINHYTLPEITQTVYTFSDIVSGDPYRVVADVYDSVNYQHILSNVVLGSEQYFWPTDNIEFDDSHIGYEIKDDLIFATEIPLFITVDINQIPADTRIRFDIYTEPVETYTYKTHRKKKFQTDDITDTLTRFFMSDLDMRVTYNVYYSLKVKRPNWDEFKFYKSHILVRSNVVTKDPGVYVSLTPIEVSSIETIHVNRAATEYYYNRRLGMHVKEYHVSDLYETPEVE